MKTWQKIWTKFNINNENEILNLQIFQAKGWLF